jgi:hypothetical protein
MIISTPFRYIHFESAMACIKNQARQELGTHLAPARADIQTANAFWVIHQPIVVCSSSPKEFCGRRFLYHYSARATSRVRICPSVFLAPNIGNSRQYLDHHREE